MKSLPRRKRKAQPEPVTLRASTQGALDELDLVSTLAELSRTKGAKAAREE